MDSTHTCVVITTTTETKEQAAELGRKLVEARLAACVQVVPIHSIYRWKDTVESTGEHRLDIKTRAECTDDVIAFISSHHPYDTPECVVTPIIAGAETYLRWIHEQTQTGESN